MSTCFDDHMLLCSHALMFTCFDDRMLSCLHTLIITCHLPGCHYSHMLGHFNDYLLICSNVLMIVCSHVLIFICLISTHICTLLDDEMSIDLKAKVIV